LLAGCVLMATLMLLAPAVSAGSPGGSAKTLSAPFAGSPLSIRDTIAEGCGNAVLSHGPTFSFSTGVGRVDAVSSANTSPACSSPVVANEGEAAGWFGLSTPNFTASSGLHKVMATWDLHWTVDLSASGAGANPGNLQTGGGIRVDLVIYDVTQHNGVADQEWTKVVNRTGDTSVHSIQSKTLTVSVNWTFNATHVYSILTVVQFVALSEIAAGASGGHATASLNLATGGNKAILVSVAEP
jgi:hypothetical protein